MHKNKTNPYRRIANNSNQYWQHEMVHKLINIPTNMTIYEQESVIDIKAEFDEYKNEFVKNA